MLIVGAGSEEPLFTGTGQLLIQSRSRMAFVMQATPRDRGEAFLRLSLAENNPHSIHHQLGVRAIQYDGTEWNAGWTPISWGRSRGNIWRFSGPIFSIATELSGGHIAPDSGVEIIYDPKLRIPLPFNMVTSVQRANKEVLRRVQGGGKTVDVVGTQIDFFVDPEIDATWAVAATSTAFLHPFAEDWVSEPLCLLLGQLVSPRLVARNFGGRSTVSLRSCSNHETNSLVACILREDPMVSDCF